MCKNTSVCVIEAVLEIRDSSVWPDSDCLYCWFDAFYEGSIGWDQEQAEMVRLPIVGAGSSLIRVLNVSMKVVQVVQSRVGAGYVLVKFRKKNFKSI